ncbi:hypothetical protein Q0590_21310 [Rhodocytophaga aerolata]|uniref:Lipoprotein n=1 Tax=Rhodocytophaga aerolata TaxID=455078 RepID=A0ABT8R9S9_9BACT|nr:hypothetical protein [Rhodocytophaga aerolata]MDO1448830.1 hypothetical protein [Rhodocytophaga aerolata]
MRKLSLHLLSLFAAVSMFTMTSCSSEEDTVDPAPTATIASTTPATAKVGDEITLSAAVVAQSKIKSIVTRLDNADLDTKTSNFTNSTSDNYSFKYAIPSTAGGKELKFTIVVTDSKDRVVNATHTVKVDATGSVRTQSAKLIYGQDNTTNGSFYTTEATGTVYKQADAKTNAAKVDFLYFYGATNLATLATPSDADAKTMYNNSTTGLQTWSKLNTTKFKELTMTKAEFEASTFASIETAATGATATKINNLTANKVIGFITEGGKKGIIFVNSVTGTSAGNIDITVKIADATAQ